jgi:3-oxoacyl-[acyl-carrier-protein] synthase-3
MAANDGRLNGNRAERPHATHAWQPRHTRYAHLTGWGIRLPERIVTNAELEAVVETTDDWIRTRTGIQERRIANDRETVTLMGFEAARAALNRANVLPSAIDLIIVATSTPEDIYPSSASKIQDLLGATQAGAFDLSAACSGFVYGLNMAAQAIRSGSINTALVIGSEVNSRVLDWTDRSTCVLFGDGAGAVLLEGSDQAGGFMDAVLGSDGSGAELLGIPTIGTTNLPEGRQMHKLHMDGREVFRFAVHIITESVRQVLDKAGLSLADVDLIVPHQANQRILSAAARNLNVSEALFYSNVHRYGNTSAASIPIALYEAEREGRLKPNDNVIVVGFGGGLTWAAAALQWQSVQERAPKGLAYRLSQGRRELQYITAFWRARALKTYRRLEAALRGSPAKHANLRESAPAKGKEESPRDRR